MKIDMRVGMTNAVATLCSIVWSGAIEAQAPNSVKLEIVTRDVSWYVADGTPYANYATVQQRTSPSAYRVFGYYTSLADVVSVNGRPAKGVNTTWENMLRLSTNSTNPPNGRAIADVNGHFTQGTQRGIAATKR